MSAVWWNPHRRVMVSDSYRSSNDQFITHGSKIIEHRQYVIGSCGDALFRQRLTYKLGSTVWGLDGRDIDAVDTNALVVDKRLPGLFLVNTSDGKMSVYQLEIGSYYAIGFGASAVMVLADLGISDKEIGDLIAHRIACVAKPFHEVSIDDVE